MKNYTHATLHRLHLILDNADPKYGPLLPTAFVTVCSCLKNSEIIPRVFSPVLPCSLLSTAQLLHSR